MYAQLHLFVAIRKSRLNIVSKSYKFVSLLRLENETKFNHKLDDICRNIV